jgi:hypothetical protein
MNIDTIKNLLNPTTKAEFIQLLDLALDMANDINHQIDAVGLILDKAHA